MTIGRPDAQEPRKVCAHFSGFCAKIEAAQKRLVQKTLGVRRLLLWSGVCLVLVAISCYVVSTDAYVNARFRTMGDEIKGASGVDLTGLRSLRASGGPAVYFADLQKTLKPLAQKVIIVDGIHGFHGYFNEIPVIFFGYHEDKAGVRHSLRRLLFTGTRKVRYDLVVPEEEMAARYGYGYKNFGINMGDPNHEDSVDAYVALIDALPEDTWLHFHCRWGHGRTSMMLVMLDIMKNAPRVALKDIVKRQHLLGSDNLFNTTPWWFGTYPVQRLEARKAFIEQFHAFICQRKAGGIRRWSEWCRQQASSSSEAF